MEQVLESTAEAGNKRKRLWESLLEEPKACHQPAPLPVSEEVGVKVAEDMGEMPPVPNDVPDPLPAEFFGPLGWVARLRYIFQPVFASLGRQLHPITMHHLCAGTGSASLALQVRRAQLSGGG